MMAGFPNMTGPGPVGMAQPQAQQPTGQNPLPLRLIQYFTSRQNQMPLDWRATLSPNDRTSIVIQLCVSNRPRGRETLADISFLSRTMLMMVVPEAPEAEVIQNSIKYEEQCYQRATDRVSVPKF